MKILNKISMNPAFNFEKSLNELLKNFSNFEDENSYKKYVELINANFYKTVSHYFPKIKLIHQYMRPSIMYGNLIPSNVLDRIDVQQTDFGTYGLSCVAVIPKEILNMNGEAAMVYDFYNRINYDELFNNHYDICHLDHSCSNSVLHICTHKAKDINKENILYAPLASANSLYLEYRNVDNGHEFKLECYRHGGSYYDK